jgi:hypothetical protein
LVIEDRSIFPAAANSPFVNYAFLVEPGEYLLSAFSVRVAKSVSKVGYSKAERGELVSAGTSKGGSFTVSVGEIVYIGHFALDCFQNPMPWRFYLDSQNDFASYLRDVQKESPGIDVDRAIFRLFKTTTMGHAFELPSAR